MKDSEFIALLNLYIDREIAAEDAVRLEAEVVSDKNRRNIYRQYCRMHKACSLLGGQFQEAEAPRSWEDARPRHGGSWTAAAAAAGLLAAACFAVVIVVRSRTAAPSPALSAPQTVALEAQAQEPSPSAIHATRGELQPVLDMRLLALDNENSGPVTLASAISENDPFAWMSRVQMEPVSRVPIEHYFRSRAVLGGPDTRTSRPDSSLQAPVEMAAFRFQR